MDRTNWARTYLAIALLSLSLISTADARIITVDDDGPADFNNIQAAVDDADNGDTIEIQPGIYTGPGNRNIGIGGKTITVRSTDPNDPDIVAGTIIDCNGTDSSPRVGFCSSSCSRGGNCFGSDSVLAGSTITNAFSHGYGGAAGSATRNFTIMNCVFTNNYAEKGGAIYCAEGYRESTAIINCTFANNFADYGSAIYLREATATISGCTFRDNSARFSGTIYAYECADGVTIADSKFHRNSAERGGAIYPYKSNARISRCSFRDNSAERGGAIRLYYCDSITVTDSEFQGNSGQWGGVISCLRSELTIVNSSFVGNSAVPIAPSGGSGGGELWRLAAAMSAPSIACLLVTPHSRVEQSRSA